VLIASSIASLHKVRDAIDEEGIYYVAYYHLSASLLSTFWRCDYSTRQIFCQINFRQRHVTPEAMTYAEPLTQARVAGCGV
jgi:hypothetical protein